MKDPQFDTWIDWLNSSNWRTFEDGFQCLMQSIDQHVEFIVPLMLKEESPDMRAKYIELIGYASGKKYIPLLADELKSTHRDVRAWAYVMLHDKEFVEAKAIVASFELEHPNEDFLVG
ncbi:HEAT repeat domain-containing protein [Microbulbifer guangxiensis]|uniref:HEAT repeat domain-containing protein n=1 Tax=Microbulbifer guangxiensis TaxID=2904249 RepID=UPI001F289916|nr:HEAT repeat domain-containing protein [Microbulbifer guangxiensis]